MTETLKLWLAKHFAITPEQVERDIRYKDVSGFLIIWTIFEQKAFKGFIDYSKISSFAKINCSVITGEIVNISESFFDRYQNHASYNNLRHRENRAEINNILKKKKTDLTNEEKMKLALYVLYRYRNNIFHGNKGARSWNIYVTQINQCVKIMTFVIDNNLVI